MYNCSCILSEMSLEETLWANALTQLPDKKISHNYNNLAVNPET